MSSEKPTPNQRAQWWDEAFAALYFEIKQWVLCFMTMGNVVPYAVICQYLHQIPKTEKSETFPAWTTMKPVGIHNYIGLLIRAPTRHNNWRIYGFSTIDAKNIRKKKKSGKLSERSAFIRYFSICNPRTRDKCTWALGNKRLFSLARTIWVLICFTKRHIIIGPKTSVEYWVLLAPATHPWRVVEKRACTREYPGFFWKGYTSTLDDHLCCCRARVSIFFWAFRIRPWIQPSPMNTPGGVLRDAIALESTAPLVIPCRKIESTVVGHRFAQIQVNSLRGDILVHRCITITRPVLLCMYDLHPPHKHPRIERHEHEN